MIIAIRSIFVSWRLTALSILTFGMGSALLLMVLSVAHAVLFKPLPFADADKLVTAWLINRKQPASIMVTSLPNARDWANLTRSLDGLAAFTEKDYTLRDRVSARVHGAAISATLFDMLGVRAENGRIFLPGEDTPATLEGSSALIISSELRARLFSDDKEIVGKNVALDGKPYQIVGVMPPRFQFPVGDRIDIWTTLSEFSEARNNLPPVSARRDVTLFMCIGRLRPGMSLSAAQQDMDRVAGVMRTHYPEYAADTGIRLLSAIDWTAGFEYGHVIYSFVAMVLALFLIVACGVFGLEYARNLHRANAFATRYALGATTKHIWRMLFTESLLITLSGTVLGAIVARGALPSVLSVIPEDIPRISESTVSVPLMLAGAFVAILASVILTTVLVSSTVRKAGMSHMANGDRSGTPLYRSRVLRALLIVESMLTLVLLHTTILFADTLNEYRSVPLGFQAQQAVTCELSAAPSQSDDRVIRRFFETVVTRLRASGAFSVAAAASTIPLTASNGLIGVSLTEDKQHPNVQAQLVIVSDEYFDALRVRLRGRDFNGLDQEKTLPVVIVNESMAAELEPRGNALGHRVRPLINGFDGQYVDRTIVGIAQDTVTDSVTERGVPQVYVPQGQVPAHTMRLLLVPNRPTPRVGQLVSEEIGRIDRDAPVSDITAISTFVKRSMSLITFITGFFAALSTIAVLLAVAAIAAIAVQHTVMRSREIALRIALGASRIGVAWFLTRDIVVSLAIGAALGTALTFPCDRIVANQLFNVSTTDPVVLIKAMLITIGIAGAASLTAMWRVARMDPAEALRWE